MDTESDEALMLQVQGGQIERLADLYGRYRTSLFSFLVRLTGNTHLSEDLLQEVFLRILKYRRTFKHRASFRTWIHQIARHACHDAWRKRRRESVLDVEELCRNESPHCSQLGPDWQTGAGQEVALLQEALAALPTESREVLVLARLQSLKYEEVARVVGCSVGAVKMRVHRALKELRQQFDALAGKESV